VNKQKKVILIVIILAMLLMIVAYAELSNQNLYVKGSATASAVQDNFKIQFTGENTKTGSEEGRNVTVEVGSPETPTATGATANSQISVNFSNLTAAGDTGYAILEIKNNSNGIEAEKVIVTAHGGDIENWITIDAVMCDAEGITIENPEENTALAVGEVTYVKITAELLQTITGENKTATIDVVLEATPKLSEKTYPITWEGDDIAAKVQGGVLPIEIEEGDTIEVRILNPGKEDMRIRNYSGAEVSLDMNNGIITISNPTGDVIIGISDKLTIV